MGKERTDYRLEIYPSMKTTAKTAVMCGLLGAAVSTAAYLFVKIIEAETLDNAIFLLKEQFDITLKDRE